LILSNSFSARLCNLSTFTEKIFTSILSSCYRFHSILSNSYRFTQWELPKPITLSLLNFNHVNAVNRTQYLT
jgi:hypothetical protein